MKRYLLVLFFFILNFGSVHSQWYYDSKSSIAFINANDVSATLKIGYNYDNTLMLYLSRNSYCSDTIFYYELVYEIGNELNSIQGITENRKDVLKGKEYQDVVIFYELSELKNFIFYDDFRRCSLFYLKITSENCDTSYHIFNFSNFDYIWKKMNNVCSCNG